MPETRPRNSRAADHRVVVVGAGIGGLVAAVLLAARGLDVTVLESADGPGGKMRRVVVDGQPVDSGPTVFTMRWVLDAVFAAAGVRLEDRLRIAPLTVLARHAWRGRSDDGADSPRLDLFSDRQRSVDAVGRFAGAAEARRFEAFCDEARRLYQTLEGPYIRSQRPGFARMVADLGPRGLATLAALGPLATLAGRLGRLLDGVWRVDGGMHAVAQALADVAAERGARMRYGRRVESLQVDGGRVTGVCMADGERLDADTVVFNGDVNALAAGRLGPGARRASAPVAPRERSLSAVTWSMHCASAGFPLTMHNVFFDDDYASEFADIFGRGRLPQRGTVYVCAQDRDDDATLRVRRPGDTERLLALVNAPALGDLGPGGAASLNDEEIDRCQRRSFALLKSCGLQLHPQAQQVVRTTPQDFERLFPATGGALYGRASHGWLAQFRRSGATSRLPGLLTVGGSVHPGPGVPMAAMSGRLAAEVLMARLDSTSACRTVAISGGMSTRSATTGAMR